MHKIPSKISDNILLCELLYVRRSPTGCRGRPRAVELWRWPIKFYHQKNRTVGPHQPGPAISQQVAGWCGVIKTFLVLILFSILSQILSGSTLGLILSSSRERGEQGRNASAELSCSWQERLSRTPVVSALTSPCCHVAATHHPPLLENISETNPGQVTAIAMKWEVTFLTGTVLNLHNQPGVRNQLEWPVWHKLGQDASENISPGPPPPLRPGPASSAGQQRRPERAGWKSEGNNQSRGPETQRGKSRRWVASTQTSKARMSTWWDFLSFSLSLNSKENIKISSVDVRLSQAKTRKRIRFWILSFR